VALLVENARLPPLLWLTGVIYVDEGACKDVLMFWYVALMSK
jgi:hypothetical protein